MGNESSEDTRLSQNKEDKIECEILKLKAEINKIEAEEESIKANSKFFTRNFVISTVLVIAGLVAFVAVMLSFYKEIFLPISQKENIELALENAKNEKRIANAEKNLNRNKRIHQEKVSQLESEKKDAELKHDKINQAYNELFDKQGKLREDYNEIAYRLDRSKKDKETIESEKNKLLLRLESYERKLSILSKFYEAYSAITSSINLYIVPEFEYEGKINLSLEQENYIKLMPNLLKTGFASDLVKMVTVMEQKEELMIDESIIQELTVEERNAFIRKANFMLDVAIVKCRENSVVARFEVTAFSKKGTEDFVVSFLQLIPIEYETPMFVYNSYKIVLDRILKHIYRYKFQAKS